MGVNLVAFFWGLAEATLFFIVPDVLLTHLAIKDPKRASKACMWVLPGALIGGLVMYFWGAGDLKRAEEIMREIPAVDQELLSAVEKQVVQDGALSLFFGPMMARPYKTYSVYAGSTGVGLLAFVLISIPARLSRFLILSWLTWWIAGKWLLKLDYRKKTFIWGAIWCSFYAWYFILS